MALSLQRDDNLNNTFTNFKAFLIRYFYNSIHFTIHLFVIFLPYILLGISVAGVRMILIILWLKSIMTWLVSNLNSCF